MKLAFISDTHLLIDRPRARLDNASDTVFKKLEWVFQYCAGEQIDPLVLAGDITDKPRSWHLLPKVSDLLARYNHAVFTYCIYGQHDLYMYSEETKHATILGELSSSGIVEILGEEPEGFEENISLYGCSIGREIPKVKNKKNINILVIHAPIAEKALWHNHKYLDAKKFLKEHKDYDLIVCGDIHRKFLIKQERRIILNTGPLIRKSADEYNFKYKPCFAVYDTETRNAEFVEVPHKPAEEVLSRDHIETEEIKEELLTEFTNALDSDIELDMEFTENLETFIKENNIEEAVADLIALELSDMENVL